MKAPSRPFLLAGGSVSSGRLGAPLALGAVALAVAFALTVSGGGPAAFAALAVLAGVVAYARSHAMRSRDGARPPLERIHSCALGPSAALHVVRCDGRRMLVGTTANSLSVLAELHSEPADSVAERTTTPSRRSGNLMAPMLLVTLLLVPAAATASPQRESVVQRADVAPSRSAETSTRTEPGVTEANAGSGPGFDRPAETSIGPPPYGTLAVLAGLALLPFALMAVTSFAKISIVLSLLRNALGTPQAPSDPVIAGIALALTVFVMGPVFGECVNRLGAVDTTSAASTLAGATRAAEPVLAFLKRNARAEEVALFVELSSAHGHAPAGADSYTVLVPAFVTTELRQAFLTGFVIFLPFLVVDMIVANILMSMGMVMVSPSSVALPFKLMLFVLIDGWPLLLKGLALSYN